MSARAAQTRLAIDSLEQVEGDSCIVAAAVAMLAAFKLNFADWGSSSLSRGYSFFLFSLFILPPRDFDLQPMASAFYELQTYECGHQVAS